MKEIQFHTGHFEKRMVMKETTTAGNGRRGLGAWLLSCGLIFGGLGFTTTSQAEMAEGFAEGSRPAPPSAEQLAAGNRAFPRRLTNDDSIWRGGFFSESYHPNFIGSGTDRSSQIGYIGWRSPRNTFPATGDHSLKNFCRGESLDGGHCHNRFQYQIVRPAECILKLTHGESVFSSCGKNLRVARINTTGWVGSGPGCHGFLI